MLHLRFKWGILLFAFIFSISSLSAQTDSRLNGRWVATVEGTTLEYIFNNGNFEIFINGLQNERGTYIASNGSLIRTSTHIHSDFINFLFAVVGIKLDSKWYTINEFTLAMRPQLIELGMSERGVNDFIRTMVSSTATFPYSVDASTLILTDSDGKVIIFNKR